MSLSDQQQRFVAEYCVDRNATQAYIRAGYSEDGAGTSGNRLLQNADIRQAIDAKLALIGEKTDATVANVLKRLMDIATADPNELIENRRVNCRYCHGIGHEFQHTDSEQKKRRLEWDKREGAPLLGTSAAERKKYRAENDGLEFDIEGGSGFDRSRRAHPDCPECRGEGEMQPFAKDTRELSEKGKALLAGIKITKDGVEIKTHDQLAALDKVARHLGMYIDRVAPVNPDGTALQMAPIMFVGVEAKKNDA